MADGLVRVKEASAGREEVVKVSAQHVEQYLAEHPGAQVLDDDWREQAVRVAKVEAKTGEKV